MDQIDSGTYVKNVIVEKFDIEINAWRQYVICTILVTPEFPEW